MSSVLQLGNTQSKKYKKEIHNVLSCSWEMHNLKTTKKRNTHCLLSCSWEIHNLKKTKKKYTMSCIVAGKCTTSKLQKKEIHTVVCLVAVKSTISKLQQQKNNTRCPLSCIQEIHNLRNAKKEIHDVLGVLYQGNTQSQKYKKRNTRCPGCLAAGKYTISKKNAKKEIHDVLCPVSGKQSSIKCGVSSQRNLCHFFGSQRVF